ncbi:MAG: hypothetical protein O8C61_03080 [Candidatus Methanoperedens sp.]|nr:hypothetical protein [Candidatus Methanoperedens sp.]
MTKLKPSVIDGLSLMICGDHPSGNFPYRSTSLLTSFFRGIDLDYRHDAPWRSKWVANVLEELNNKPSLEPDYPSPELKSVIEHILDPTHFINLNHERAIEQVNQLLKSQNLIVEKDKNTGNVTLCKVIDGFVSTSTDIKEVKKVITFSPSVFTIPKKPVVNNLVSVMMPFAMEFDNVLETTKAACSNTNMRCNRVDDLWNNSTIIQDIFELIYCSSIVIVDFTDKNPNVFYEAGIAHTLGKNVIPITQNIEDIPFDLRHHRVLKYLKNKEGLQELKNSLENRLNTLKQSGKQ